MVNTSLSFLFNSQTMEPFNIETFVEEPTLRVVKSLKKAELVSVAQHYKLEVGSTMKKSQIKQLVIDYLVEEEICSIRGRG